MSGEVVEQLLDAARRTANGASRVDDLVRRASILNREKLESRVNSRVPGSTQREPAPTSAPTRPTLPTTNSTLPRTGVEEPTALPRGSDGLIEQQPLPLQQQRIEGGMRGLETAARDGDPDAVRMLDEAETRFTNYVMQREELSYGRELARRDETGVYIPPRDPTPRFSIDDSASRINPTYLRTINQEADRVAIASGVPNGWGGVSAGVRVLPLGNRAMANLKLGDILDHPELYRYYPQAKDIKIRRVESGDVGVASYNPKDNTISLRPTWESLESARSSIIHELQHYVQTKEGFARGGSPVEFLPPELRDPKKVEERLNLLDRKVEIYENRLKSDPENTRTRGLLDDAFLERERVFKQLEDANTEYRRLLGEKEARDAQARLNMTPLERELNPPVTLNEKAMADAKVLQTNQSASGNIVPGMSFEQGHIVFHGGPVSAIDQFMLKYIGTGEGAIMRGWGFYFAERPGISAGYRDERFIEKSESITETRETFYPRLLLVNIHNSREFEKVAAPAHAVGDNIVKTYFPNVRHLESEAFYFLEEVAISAITRLSNLFVKRSDPSKLSEDTIKRLSSSIVIEHLNTRIKNARAEQQDMLEAVAEAKAEGYRTDELSYERNYKKFGDVIEFINKIKERGTTEYSDYVQALLRKYIEEYKKLPTNKTVAREPGLFVLDIKANKDLDYIHLDEYLGDQPTKINQILTANIEDPTLRKPTQNGEFIVKTLEGMMLPTGLDSLQFNRFTEEGKKALVRAHRQTLDTSDVSDEFMRFTMNRKFASLALKEMGIPGSAHYDAMSRWKDIDRGDKTNNFVIWDEDIIEQLAVQPYSWRDRGKLEVDPTDHPLTDEYQPQ